ncbi:hypothetical protein SACC_23370 [Saccharolobus caldissimus]|uniref:Uncharacterized protein n=1 Tax=Saccharolobus caldissimus TaxID=1702097 RepID=A0AAQ4CU39_9CREN|nr:hypothetical protein SACC_23370 [Saccharolobus caldissimus]
MQGRGGRLGQTVHLVSRTIKNGSSRGKTKYKCNACKRTFYDTNSHSRGEEKERILKEYLNRMSIRGIAKVEEKP